MRTTILASDFAVKIDGIDLAGTLDDATFNDIRGLWMQHKVAVFPGQTLDDDALLRFAGRFGPIFRHAQSTLHSPDYGEVMYMSNRQQKALVEGELGWHSDQSYTAKPVFGTILYGIEIPDDGGETCFADLSATYDALPDGLRRRVDAATAIYSAEKPGHKRRVALTDEERSRIPDVAHPLVRTHPYLGRKALYLSPMHIKAIEGLPPDESDALLADLTARATDPARVYVHRWTPGDVIMWDNTSVMHRRNHFAPEQPRFHKRTGFYLPDALAAPF
jgi:putative 2-oxoglutarate oxygenase